MKVTLFTATLLAALVSADSTSTAASSTSTCAAQAILDACLDTTEGYVVLCGSQDYSCLCDKYNAIMTCFANCPGDSRQYALGSERDLYCMNASAFQTKTTATLATATSAVATATHAVTTGSTDSSSGDASSTSGGGGGNNHETTTTSASPLSPTGNNSGAAAGVQQAGGLLAVLAGVAVAALV